MNLTEYTVEFVNIKEEALHVNSRVYFLSARNEQDAIEQASNFLEEPAKWELLEVNEV